MLFVQLAFMILSLTLFRTSPSLAVERSHCETIFIRQRTPMIVLAGEIKQSSPSDLRAFIRKDVTNDFFFSARLSEKKVLTFSTILKMFELPVRSGLYGPRLFREMMDHFGVENVDVVVGRWLVGSNFDVYRSSLKSGASPEEAALLTWTGRQASFYGFNKVRSVHEDKNSTTGQVTVVVEFIRE